MTKPVVTRDLVTTIREGLDWYAFTVHPTSEYTAAALLRLRGIDTFVPTETRWRATNRFTKSRRIRHEECFPALPGYVFAGFSGEPPWYGISFIRSITGVVGSKNRPHPIVAKDLRRFFATTANGTLRAPAAQRHMQTREEFGVGDRAEVVAGPFVGHVVDVVEIKGAMAKALMPLFNVVRKIDLPLENLSKSD